MKQIFAVSLVMEHKPFERVLTKWDIEVEFGCSSVFNLTLNTSVQKAHLQLSFFFSQFNTSCMDAEQSIEPELSDDDVFLILTFTPNSEERYFSGKHSVMMAHNSFISFFLTIFLLQSLFLLLFDVLKLLNLASSTFNVDIVVMKEKTRIYISLSCGFSKYWDKTNCFQSFAWFCLVHRAFGWLGV